MTFFTAKFYFSEIHLKIVYKPSSFEIGGTCSPIPPVPD